MRLSNAFPRRGGLLVFLGLTIAVGGLVALLLSQASVQYAQGARLRDAVALRHLLEAGSTRAQAELRRNASYTGSAPFILGPGEIRIAVKNGNVEITAAVPGLDRPRRSETRVLGK